MSEDLPEDLSLIFEAMGDAVMVADKTGGLIYVNNSACSLLGYSAMEISGYNIQSFFPSNIAEELNNFIKQKSAATNVVGKVRMLDMLGKNGESIPIELRLNQLQDGRFVALIRDRSKEVELHDSLDIISAEHNSLLEMLDLGIILLDPDMNILSTNTWINRLLPDIADSNQNFSDFLSSYYLYDENDNPLLLDEKAIKSVINNPKTKNTRFHLLSDDRSIDLWLMINCSEIIDPRSNKPNTLITFTDVTEVISVQYKLQKQANTDALTNLPNRHELINRLKHAIDFATSQRIYCASLFIDLDDFKEINETYGSEYGDKVIIEFSRRIKSCLRKGDVIGRNGGDEFLVILIGLNKDKDLAATNAVNLCERVIHEIEKPMIFDDVYIHTTCSIGLSFFHDDETTYEDVIHQADLALFKSKAKGKRQFTVFSKDLEKEARKAMSIKKKVRKAVEDGCFYPVFQPQVTNDDECRVIGAEVLMRCKFENGDQLFPDSFIPILESNGDIVTVGAKLIHYCFEQIQKWKQEDIWPEDFTLSLNLSVKQITNDTFLDMLLAAMEKWGVKSKDIILEITESLAVHSATETLNALHEKGFTISLDDFGTGYSSLSYINQLPIHHLKIDKSFIQSSDTDAGTMHLLNAMQAIGNAFDLVITAEGVETDKHVTIMRKLGCDYLQGFYYFRPVEQEEFENLLKSINNEATIA